MRKNLDEEGVSLPWRAVRPPDLQDQPFGWTNILGGGVSGGFLGVLIRPELFFAGATF